MKTTIAALVSVALVAGSVGCAKGASGGPAWTRWGITKPTTEDSAEAALAEAYRLFYAQKTDSARQIYQDLVGRFPQSAEAHLGLSMAYRYLSNRDTALAEARAALKLDSAAVGALLDYADLIAPGRTGPVPDMTDSARFAEADRANLKAAKSKHPLNAYANVQLLITWRGPGSPTHGTRLPSSAASATTRSRCSTTPATSWSAWNRTRSSSQTAITIRTRSGRCNTVDNRSGRTWLSST